jgi:hypothetical protein
VQGAAEFALEQKKTAFSIEAPSDCIPLVVFGFLRNS